MSCAGLVNTTERLIRRLGFGATSFQGPSGTPLGKRAAPEAYQSLNDVAATTSRRRKPASVMVYNPDIDQETNLIHAILTADLTPPQLAAVHERFGLGAMLDSPYPRHQLYITDKRSWSSLSHLEIWNKTPHHDDEPGYFPIIIVDAETPNDNAVWFIDRIADQFDIDHKTAESLKTLFKIRMDLNNIILSYVNYEIANTDIREAMDEVGVPYPTPEDFT